MKNTTLLGLYARTSIAAGTGQNLGAIDLPIMREAPTDYPVIYGSAIKGAMRAKFEAEIGKDAARVYFGDDDAGGSKYAGALIVSDARMLLLPVRSLTSHFRWVTCPYILRRFAQDCQMLGIDVKWTVPQPGSENRAVVAEQDDGSIYLEEFKFEMEHGELDALIETLDMLMDEDMKDIIKKQLAIVSDDMFAHLSRYSTPVNAHIAIDNESKTVKPGALWYEESLPPETLLYSMLITGASRKEGDVQAQAEIIRKNVVGHLEENSYLQVGGNETVGMGWCKVVCHD